MTKNAYLKTSVGFGLLGAGLIFLYFICFYILDKNPLIYLSTFDLIFPVICMALAMFYFRDKIQGGTMHFWEGLYIGLLTNFIATFISTVAIYLFITFGDTHLLERHIADLQDLLIKTKTQINEQFGKGAFENTLQRIDATTTANVAVDIFIKKFLTSLFASGFIAAVLRKT